MTNKNINTYIINKNDECFDINKINDLLKDIEFPYRRLYMGDSSTKIFLEKIFDIPAIIKEEAWSIPNGKIVNKIKNFWDIYYLSKTVISSIDDHWIYDIIIDYYSEYARIRTPGYGEKYSPYTYWINPNLHKRWINTYKKYISLEDIREMIYKNIQEARPAYSLISKSLYKALMNLNIKDSYKILDIAAYGERAIAASSLENVDVYDGIDPNYDLIYGHDLLSMDLESLNPNCNIKFIHIGLEDFKTNKKYDIITYSPPPYDTEPYGSDNIQLSNTQTYNKYPTFNEYVCCFLVEIIYKAKIYSNIGTIFSVTALDRNPDIFSIKIKDKSQISKNIKLIYVEVLLLIISCYGFQYQGAIGLAAGGKKAGVPWWTFKYNNSIEPYYFELLQANYPDIYKIIAPRLISNYFIINNNLHPLFDKLVSIIETKEYKISSFIQKETNVILELIRLQIQQYVIEIISKLSNIKIEKIRVLLGRYLMLRSINASFQMPWESCLYLDPIFPTNNINSTEIDETLVNYFIEQKIKEDLAHKIVYDYKYWFGSYECIGISNLYNTIANYITSLPISNIETVVETNNNITIIRGNNNAVSLLDNIPKGRNLCGINNILWKGVPDIDILPYLRYETLGATGHQYTRPTERTYIIEKIFNTPMIDIYASIYNNQSKKYCSIYPDVEKDSIGSAFCLRMIEGAYLANPVDIPIFIKKSLNNIIYDLNIAKLNNKKLCISMGFTVWLDNEPEFISKFDELSYKELFKNSKNIGLNILAESEFVSAVYILDKNKFPSVLLDKSHNRDGTISVGVLLCSLLLNIDKKLLYKLVEDKKFIQYNIKINNDKISE
jgi:hypothetical protein